MASGNGTSVQSELTAKGHPTLRRKRRLSGPMEEATGGLALFAMKHFGVAAIALALVTSQELSKLIFP